MRYVFPAVFRPEPEGGYMVFCPDIEEAVTQGDTIADCIEMAEDVLCLMLYERELNSIILSKHCIKSETNNDIHGINYLNIPKERFINVYIPKSISKIILNKNNEDLPINSEEMYFNIRIQDNILKNDFCFIIKSKPIPHTYDINIILITIFLKKYESKLLKDIFKINDHNKKIKNRNIQLILIEEISKIKFLSFDLILD